VLPEPSNTGTTPARQHPRKVRTIVRNANYHDVLLLDNTIQPEGTCSSGIEWQESHKHRSAQGWEAGNGLLKILQLNFSSQSYRNAPIKGLAGRKLFDIVCRPATRSYPQSC
jgi:hypothetical protein